MNINITNGYKLKKVSSLKKFNEELILIKDEINKKYYEEYHKELALFIGLILDMKRLNFSTDKIRDILYKIYHIKLKESIALDDLVEYITRKEFTSNNFKLNHFHYACKISVYIVKDNVLLRIVTDKPNILSSIGYEDTDWIKHNGNLPELIPWGFDSEDELPTTLSTKEWNERRMDWEIALKEKPLKIRINDFIDKYDKNLVLKMINDNFKERCKNLTNAILIDKGININKMNFDDEYFKRKTYTEIYRSLKDFFTINDLDITI